MPISTAASRGGLEKPPSGIQSGTSVAVTSAACGVGSSRSLIRSISSSAADKTTPYALRVLTCSKRRDLALEADGQRFVRRIEQHAARVDRAGPLNGAGRRLLPAQRAIIVLVAHEDNKAAVAALERDTRHFAR